MLMTVSLSCNVCTHLTRHFYDLIQSFYLKETQKKNTIYTVLKVLRRPLMLDMKRFVKCYFELLTHNQSESAKVQSAKGLHFAFSACGFGLLLLLDEVVPLTADTPCTQNTAHVALGILHRPLRYSGFGCGLYNVLAGKLFPACQQVKYQPFRLFGLGGGVAARTGQQLVGGKVSPCLSPQEGVALVVPAGQVNFVGLVSAAWQADTLAVFIKVCLLYTSRQEKMVL